MTDAQGQLYASQIVPGLLLVLSSIWLGWGCTC
jgi:hypothetical protein